MLVLSRQRDETIVIGNDRTCLVELSAADVQHLQSCRDTHLQELAARLIGSMGVRIDVQVVDMRGDKVRVGIAAPRALSVHRKEVYDAIQRDRKAAEEARAAVQPTT